MCKLIQASVTSNEASRAKVEEEKHAKQRGDSKVEVGRTEDLELSGNVTATIPKCDDINIIVNAMVSTLEHSSNK